MLIRGPGATALARRWAEGSTGYPFVDAAMLELKDHDWGPRPGTTTGAPQEDGGMTLVESPFFEAKTAGCIGGSWVNACSRAV